MVRSRFVLEENNKMAARRQSKVTRSLWGGAEVGPGGCGSLGAVG